MGLRAQPRFSHRRPPQPPPVERPRGDRLNDAQSETELDRGDGRAIAVAFAPAEPMC